MSRLRRMGTDISIICFVYKMNLFQKLAKHCFLCYKFFLLPSSGQTHVSLVFKTYFMKIMHSSPDGPSMKDHWGWSYWVDVRQS